jgi:malonyl CoA-acyl carrier protein transacylase/thioesterase domain-containing protein/acyl carrier protein
VLALRHRKIPPTLHFKTLNPLIDNSKMQFQVVDRLTEWKSTGEPRRAGVTALGIGGTNAHVILEEAPEPAPSQPGRPVRLVTLSAKTPAALDDATRALAGHLREFPDENLDDMAYTLHVGRTEFAHRRMFVARDYPQALRCAERPQPPAVATAKASDSQPMTFLFSGQGTQHCGMGRDLYQTEPVFRKWIDTCAVQAQPHLGFDFREILYPTPAAAAVAAEQLKLTWNAQPILFAVEYALAQLWMSWGIRPAKLIGHSLGEYPAACVSGIFTLEDALSLVCIRGNLMKKVADGAMLAVSLSETEAARWINGDLGLATVNAPEQCVISGPTAAVLALSAQLKEHGIPSHRLETSHAFHSSLIDPVLDAFVNEVRKRKLRAPQIPLVSNVTGAWLTEKEATDPAYWARHFRETVQFCQGLKALQADAASFLIEVGPGDTLCSLVRQNADEKSRPKAFPSLPRSGGKDDELSTLLSALGNLWINGVHVDWKAFHAHEKLRRIPLPTYCFQHKRYWMGPKIGPNWLDAKNGTGPLVAPSTDASSERRAGSPATTSLTPAAPVSGTKTRADSAPVPSDKIELVLKQLWQRLLGLDEVDADTDFFDSGGHSLLAVRLFTDIRKRFNVDFPLSTLFEARTVGALAELIRKTREADSSGKKSPSDHALVPIRSRGMKTPLFLIHDVGGTVLRYEHLARCFPDDQAIFAIESRGLSGLSVDFNVKAMALHYIEQIRKQQPHGPYFVAGHSFGGLVTYEIARQLSAQNETMGLVGLLDTYQRNLTEEDALLQPEPLNSGKLPILQRLLTDIQSQFTGRDRVGYLRERRTYIQAWALKTLYRSAYKSTSRLGWSMPSFLNDVKEANWIANDYFTPGTYEGTVVFFRCQNRLETDPPDSSLIWKRLVKGELVIHEVPGDHNSMLQEPNVQVLAEQILSYLKPETVAGSPTAVSVQ